jgi:hypothetical protein
MEQGGALRLCSNGRRLPCQIGFGSEEAKGGSADHVTLKVEGVANGGMGVVGIHPFLRPNTAPKRRKFRVRLTAPDHAPFVAVEHWYPRCSTSPT